MIRPVTIRMSIIALGLCASLLAPSAASTQTDSVSAYTSTGTKACSVAKGESDTRICPGVAGLVVVVSEDDLRETVSVGRNRAAAMKEPAAQAWFSPFSSTTPTIEWRAASGQPPHAIIQRWHLADGRDIGGDGSPRTKALLIVTRLPPGAVCHVAYIDVAANPNANELARTAADTVARDFVCGKDKVQVIGAPGRAVELAH